METRKYIIKVTEIRTREFEIETSKAEEALDTIKTLYRNNEIVLEKADVKTTDFLYLGVKQQ